MNQKLFYNSTKQRHKGNMLILTVLGMALVIVILFIASVPIMLLFGRHQAQNVADQQALSAASALNQGDRIGQMNNILARSRELVFNSRLAYNRALTTDPYLEPLARRLLEKARMDAQMLGPEKERLLIQQIFTSLSKITSEQGVSLSLPWMTIYKPSIEDAAAGYLDGMQSNVYAPTLEGNPELRAHDIAQGYIQQDSNLYAGNINAKLPAPDSDLNFYLSSAPAPVKGTVAPTRLVSEKSFKEMAPYPMPEYFLSAVRLRMSTKVTSKIGGSHQGMLQVSQVAVCNGANTPPK